MEDDQVEATEEVRGKKAAEESKSDCSRDWCSC